MGKHSKNLNKKRKGVKKHTTRKATIPAQDGVGGNKNASPPPPMTTNSGWTRPPNISPKFDLLLRKDISNLTVAKKKCGTDREV